MHDAWTCVLAAIALAHGAACGSDKPAPAPQIPIEEAIARAAPVYAALERVAASFPPIADLELEACPTRLPGAARLSWNSLAEKIGAPLDPEVPRSRGITREADRGALRSLPARASRGGSTAYVQAAEELAGARHLLVFRVLASSGADVRERGDNTFGGGFALGWLVAFELESGRPICQAPVRAENSSKISVAIRPTAGAREIQQSAEVSALVDLAIAMQRALSDAERAMGV